VTVLGDIVARERRSDAVAVRTDSRARSYSYGAFCTQSWKAGNLLRHYGVRGGATVAVDAGQSLSPPPLVTLFGAALLGARVAFDPAESVDAGALVVPTARVDTYDPPPGTRVLAYGEDPDDPEVSGFEREVWSENPTIPPDAVAPDAVALVADGTSFSHERLLAATERVVDEAGLDAETVVAPRAPLADPGVVVAGLVAPLSVGGTVLIDEAATGDVGVGTDVPEPRAVSPAAVL